jgi:hypothetical protein
VNINLNDFTPLPLGDTIDEITAPRCKHQDKEWRGANWTCSACGETFREADLREAAGYTPRKPAAPTPAPAPVFALAPDSLDPESYKGNALAARVAAANRANYAVTEYHRYIVAKLRPFLNQKVLKNSSWGTTLTKKVSDAIGDAITAKDSGEHFTISTQGHWITVRCTVSRHYEEYRHCSWEAYATAGKTGGTDTLQALESEPPKLRIDYTEGEIRGKRQVIAGLREQLRDAESKLEGFGEYDQR